MAAPYSTPHPHASALDALCEKAKRFKHEGLNYAGEITPAETMDYLSQHGGLLVDVRTLPEWQFTGVADLSATQGKLLTISWKTYPDYALNPQFVERLSREPGVDHDTPLFFICRSGGRSLDAALAMTDAGYRYCFNITGGFEGEQDIHGHRGMKDGWKAANLPWRQG